MSEPFFVADRVTYTAWTDADRFQVFGQATLGPYKELMKERISSDGKHLLFAAKKGEVSVVVIDGQERELPGSAVAYEIGPAGQVAYAVKVGNTVKVHFAGSDLSGDYGNVSDLTISPDGKHVAFWAMSSGNWSVVTDTKSYPGFQGRYFYDSGGQINSIMWGPDSTSLAYFAKKTKDAKDVILVLNGTEQADWKGLPGLALSVYRGETGDFVGVQLMNGPRLDHQAFVSCLATREQNKCDPIAATLVGGQLAWVDEKGSYVTIGSRKDGPFSAVKSVVMASNDGKHYAYVVGTENAQRMVIDGKPMEFTYEAIYRPAFVTGSGLAHLGIRDGKVFSVRYPF